MKVKDFGKISDGRSAHLYTLVNANGMKVDITDIGAAIRSIRIPDENGDKVDVVLGYDEALPYETGDKFFGATVGRFAGQVKDACFTMNGETYKLPKNDGPNCLHGGDHGFKTRLFDVEVIDDSSVKCTYVSPDLEEGFPGNLKLEVVYKLNDSNGIEIHYNAVSDKDTILNITNHSYFNLDGSENVLDHYLTIDADRFTPDNSDGMPYGDIFDVEGTPMDFRQPHTVGERMEADYEQVHIFHGYDHNFCLNAPLSLEKAKVILENPTRTRRLEVYTDYPGVQLYTGNFLGRDNDKGKGNKPFSLRQALCLETQMWPNAYGNEAFPNVVIKKGEHYKHNTEYRFIWKY